MSELGEKVRKSIERLKLYEPEDGYYLAFSGGKDSVTCKALMEMAGVKYDATYRREFARWPKYEWHYRHAFEKMLELRRERFANDPSKPVWRSKAKDNNEATVEDVWRWWMDLPLDDPGGVSNEP